MTTVPTPTIVPAPPPDARAAALDTASLQGHLRERSVRGVFATGGTQVFKFVNNLAAGAILARLLTPADFGLIAMAAAFTGLASVLRHGGLSIGIVQREHVSHDDASQLFWLNVGVAAATALALVALGPALAALYGEPRVVLVMAVLSIATFLGGFGAVPEFILKRQMRFGTLTVIEVLSMVTGSVTALAMAWYGWGYLSLVWMQVVSGIVVATGMCLACGWRPARPRWKKKHAARNESKDEGGIARFGGQLTLASLLNYGCRRLDNVLLGVVYGAGPLGLYAKAYNLLLLPIQQINVPVSTAATPTLCRLKDRPDDFRRAYLAGLAMTAGLGMPLVAWMWSAAGPLIGLVFGPQWTGAVPLFEALAPAALVGTFNIAAGWLFIPQARGAAQLRATLLATVVIALGYIVALPFGVVAVAWSFSLTLAITQIATVAYACRGTSVSFRSVLATLLPPAFAAGIAAASARLLTGPSGPLGHFMPAVTAAAAGGICLAVYAAVLAAMPSGRRLIRGIVVLLREKRIETHP